MNNLRVLTIGHSYVVATNRCEVDRLARHPGHEVTVAAPRFFHGDLRPVHLEPAVGAAYRLVGLPCLGTRSPHAFFYRGIARTVAERPFDLIYAWEEPYVFAGYQAARAARAAKVPFVFRTDQNLAKRYPPPFSTFERYCIAGCAGWIATGEVIAETMLARGYPRATMALIPHGVDEEAFYPNPAARDALRARLGIDGVVVGYVGRLVAEKGLDVLMKALGEVRENWHLLVVGSGPYAETLRDWAKSRGLQARVHLVFAKHAEVPSYLAAMDLLVAPSQTTARWKEQLGRMIIEAFACGVPAIGSDSGEIPFVIGDAGIVAGEQDTGAWTAAIRDLVRSEERRRQLGAAGNARFHAAFSAKRVAEQYVDFFARLLHRVPGTPD